jgi:hypothetical protein
VTDFIFYRNDQGFIYLRSKNWIARKHIEDNVSTYSRWIALWRDPNTVELFGPGVGAYFLKPLANPNELAQTLVDRGLTIRISEEQEF